MYELLCKQVPFGANENDPYKIYEKIIEKKIIYNDNSHQVIECKKIIEQLLCKNVNLRMPGGISKFKLHNYFTDLDWDMLKIKKIKAPLIPKYNKIDSSNIKNLDFISSYEKQGQANELWDKEF